MSSFFGWKPKRKVDVKPFEYPSFVEGGSISNPKTYLFTRFDEGEGLAASTSESKEQAREIRGRAEIEAQQLREEARRILKEAKRISETAAEQGWKEGHEAGLSQGRQEGRTAFEEEIGTCLNGLRSIEDLYTDLWAANEGGLVKLATVIAERVIYKEITTSPEIIADLFKVVIDHLQGQHEAVFRLHPEDLAQLESVRAELRDQIKGLVKISFEADAALSRGDLIMETDAGRLDATLKHRIKTIIGLIEERLKENSPPVR